jgi:hemerythrin-like domain-containing protein
MKNITSVLSDEHQNILKVIESMLSTCEKIEAGDEIDPVYFENAVAFIKNYADTYHHAKEEEILFKAMLNNVNGMHCNPIPVMLYEHDEGRSFVKGLETGLENNNKQEILDNARGYCYLLKDHIYKEDNVLYPMAEEALNDEQKDTVQQLYDEVNAKNEHHTELLQYFGL